MPREELNLLYWKIERYIKKKYFKQICKFKMFWIDKPLVHFIRVHDEYKRLGIGTQLYLEAARWMKERNMYLHASTTQGNETKRCWNKFLNNGLAKNYNGRIILDV